MARKKTTTKTGKQQPSLQVNEDLLTEKQVREVWDFAQFALSLNGGTGASAIYPGVLTPMLLNERMKDVNLNPLYATQDQLDAALKNPKDNEVSLQSISEGFEILSQPYKRLISYLGNMLSFDMTYTCVNADKDDYTTNAYKNELKQIEAQLDRFQYENIFQQAIREMIRNEAYFCSPRFDAETIVLQELPASPNYTMITGKWDYGYLFSFNMYWFMLPGVDINMYDPFFARAFNSLWGVKGKPKDYKPHITPEMREASAWVYWQDIAPPIGWAFKLTPELSTRLPYFTGVFNDLILQPLIRNLQKNIQMAEASKLIAGQVPFLKDTQSKVADQIAMNPDTLAKFLQLVASAVSTAVKTMAAPLDNIQGINFEGDNEMYSSYWKNTLGMTGVNTNLIYSGNTRPNMMESQLSLNTDEQLMYSVYPQFEYFMDYNINEQARVKKFRWKFNFEGTKFFTNRNERFERQQWMVQNGMVMPQKISAAIGMRWTDMRRQMEEAKANGFVDGLTPVLQAAQMGGFGKTQGAGRPETPDAKLSDAGEQTKSDGENLGRGGKTQ